MPLFPTTCTALAVELLNACNRQGLRLATAESCTGGLIAGCLTEIAGSSAVVDRGYVVYDDRAKTEMLGVSVATLHRHGAVSEATGVRNSCSTTRAPSSRARLWDTIRSRSARSDR